MKAMFRHLVNLLLMPFPPTRLFGLRRALLRLANIELEEGVCVCGGGWFFGRGRVRIGRQTWLSPGVRIYTHLHAPVEIGARCDIGPDVKILTGSHEIGSRERRAGCGTAAPVKIGAGCWIGAGSLILGGVTIGSGCIVAAGSVVTRDMPEQILAAGVPAQKKKRLP